MRKKVFHFFWLLHLMLLLPISAIHSQNALFVHKTNENIESSLLEHIQRITFEDDHLIVKISEDNTMTHPLDGVAKVTFEDMISTDATNPDAIKPDAVVYITLTGDIVVESPATVQSLMLFTMEGKMLRIATTTINVSAFPTGVYLLRINTEKGLITKKMIIK